jgi:hypothetical protein
MRKHAFILMFVTAAGLLLSNSPRPAHAQEVLGLWYKLAEKIDETQLQHDQARLQSDIRKGDTARVNRDLEQIRRDEWWLTVDRRRRRFGPTPPLPQPTALSAALVPHPQYPGYGYDPSNPTQLYHLTQPAPVLNPAPGGGASSHSAPGSTPGTTTRAQVSVVILNSEQTGVAVNYVVDDITYRTESGGLQRLVVSPSSTIRFDRVGAFGVQQYTLSAGVYEFRSSEMGWALVRTGTGTQLETRTSRVPVPVSVPRR